MLRGHCGRWARRVRSSSGNRRCVRAVVRRGPRAAGAARVALRVQQHRSCVCGGVGGEDVRADVDAAADGDVDEPPCTCPSQPDRCGWCHRQRENGSGRHAGNGNQKEGRAAACASGCQRRGRWRPSWRRSPTTASHIHAAKNDGSQAPCQRVGGDECLISIDG